MDAKTKIWSVAASAIAITIILAAIAAWFFWQQLPPDEKAFFATFLKNHLVFFFTCGFLILIGLGLLLDGIIHIYVLPIQKLIEETTLISTINPAHRIVPMGSQDVKLLAGIINNWGDLFQELQRNIEQEIQAAKADVEREKNILAAFMAEFREGVLICNIEGRILLYNKRAGNLFCRPPQKSTGGNELDAQEALAAPKTQEKIIGLGRSIFRIIDKPLIVHALDEIAEKLNRKEMNAVSYFVTVSRQDTLLRVEMAPVLNSRRQLIGMILVLYDISEQLEKDHRATFLVQSLTNRFRASLSSIRSAIETVMVYPNMDAGQRHVFRKIIHDESMALGNLVDKLEAEYPRKGASHWPLVSMLAKDLIDTVCRKARDQLGVRIDIADSAETRWVKVDSYTIILAILFLLNQLKNLTGNNAFTIRIENQDLFVGMDLVWSGDPVRIEILRQWDAQALMVGGEGLPLTLKEVVRHHHAEIWSYTSPTTKGESYLRLFLPSVKAVEPDIAREIPILTEVSRPVFYDFDLFTQTHLTAETGDRLLTELEYTVFDTETTGMNPRGGDEIISIGAVRIINGQLLSEERFDQLVDPRRGISRESIKIHGIRPEMLAGQPTIDKVLPAFHRFCENTVLVAHNAAFDILMLKMKETATGVNFTHPVLDTLLLSDALHPAHRDHDIETIAKRLGISVIGRHTALGDALTTAEILLKMIPLLAIMGIYTLKDALQISKKSYYARLKY